MPDPDCSPVRWSRQNRPVAEFVERRSEVINVVLSYRYKNKALIFFSVSHDNDQPVARFEFQAPVGDDIFLGTPDHDNPDTVGEVQVTEGSSHDQVVFRDDVVPQQPHLFRNLHAEGLHNGIFIDAEVQLPGNPGQGTSLYDKG